MESHQCGWAACDGIHTLKNTFIHTLIHALIHIRSRTLFDINVIYAYTRDVNYTHTHVAKNACVFCFPQGSS